MLPILNLVVLVGNRHKREEEYRGHLHSDTLYKHEEGLEGDKDGSNEGRSKTSLTPLWKYVTKPWGRGWNH
jgi:hypothetical protein